MPRPHPFRINAKSYFLTYPQCSLSKDEAVDQLRALAFPTNLKYIRVCEETHQDGSLHLHALLQFEGKFQCTNRRFFDLVSSTRSANFHPNIQGAKLSSDVKKYIEKEGVCAEWGEFQIDARSATGTRIATAQVYADALNTGSKIEALNIIKERDPKTFLSHMHILDRNFDKIFQPPAAPANTFINKWAIDSFAIDPKILQWAEDNIVTDPAARPRRPKSIIIEGPSGIGKTAWARSLGSHNYICGHIDLNPRTFNNDALYNVIDNVSPKYLSMKHWKELIGAKRDWQTNCRYGKPNLIRGGIPSIILCSPGPDTSFQGFLEKNSSLKEWTILNAEFYNIQRPMFKIQNLNGANSTKSED